MPASKSSAKRSRAENHTVKRSLTDPHLFSGIGNAYSDEILHRAGFADSPHAANDSRRNRNPLPRDQRIANRLGGALAQRKRVGVSGKSHGFPRRHGRPRQVPQAVSGLRLSRSTDRSRRERNQLLPALSNRRKIASGPIAVAAPQERFRPRTLEELEEVRRHERSEGQWIFLCGKRPAASGVTECNLFLSSSE